MGRVGRHGKQLTNIEETYMDLLIKIEQSEEYLKRNHTPKLPDIKIDPDDLELYPSFSVVSKNKYSSTNNEQDRSEKRSDYQVRYASQETIRPYTFYKDIEDNVKLTIWEWLEARKKGIFMIFVIVSVFMSQILSVWMQPSLFTLFCKTYVYVGSLCIIVIVLHWIFSGGLHRYLNEES